MRNSAQAHFLQRGASGKDGLFSWLAQDDNDKNLLLRLLSGIGDCGRLIQVVEMELVGGAQGSLGDWLVLGAGLENELGVWWGS